MQAFVLGVFATVGALLPITNPFSTAPVFVTVTRSFSDAQRNDTARRACIYMVFVLLTTLLAGALILEFFGITVPIMRIAGGLIIARAGFGMVNPEPEQQMSKKSREEALELQDVAFTPIAMPLLSGPGSIAVTISLATLATGVFDYLSIAIGIVAVAGISWLVLRSSAQLVDHLSVNGMNVFTRLMGFILVCIGIQFVFTGLLDGLSDPELVRPITKAFLGQTD